MKKILTVMMASAFVLFAVGCSSTGSSTASSGAPSPGASSSAVSSAGSSSSEQSSSSTSSDTLPTPNGAGDPEKTYVEELSKLLPAISKIQEVQLAAATDPEDAQAVLDDLKKQFTALGELKAPPAYQAAQSKFAECSDALIELIDYSQEIAKLSDEEATPEKALEATEKMEALSTQATEAMETATKMIWGDNAQNVENEENAQSSSGSEA